MPIATDCPTCKAMFRLENELAGKKVKCQKCQSTFIVPAAVKPAPAIDMDLGPTEAEKQAAPPATAIAAAAPKPYVPKQEDEDEDDRPRTNSKPPPIKKTHADSDSSVRIRRPAPKAGTSPGMIALMAVLLGGGLLSCVACAGGATWLVFTPAEKAKPRPVLPAEPVAVVNNQDRDIRFDPPPVKLKKKNGPPFDGFQDKQLVLPPPQDTNVIFGADGVFTTQNMLSPLDPRNQDNKPHKVYVVRLEEGQNYQIDLISNQFDPYLYLMDDLNQIVAKDDDGGGYPNARIGYRPARSGLHRIQASRFGGGVGNFTLTIRRIP